MALQVTTSEIAELWLLVARLRKAKGDKSGEAQARVNARAYQKRPRSARYE